MIKNHQNYELINKFLSKQLGIDKRFSFALEENLIEDIDHYNYEIVIEDNCNLIEPTYEETGFIRMLLYIENNKIYIESRYDGKSYLATIQRFWFEIYRTAER